MRARQFPVGSHRSDTLWSGTESLRLLTSGGHGDVVHIYIYIHVRKLVYILVYIYTHTQTFIDRQKDTRVKRRRRRDASISGLVCVLRFPPGMRTRIYVCACALYCSSSFPVFPMVWGKANTSPNGMWTVNSVWGSAHVVKWFPNVFEMSGPFLNRAFLRTRLFAAP